MQHMGTGLMSADRGCTGFSEHPPRGAFLVLSLYQCSLFLDSVVIESEAILRRATVHQQFTEKQAP